MFGEEDNKCENVKTALGAGFCRITVLKYAPARRYRKSGGGAQVSSIGSTNDMNINFEEYKKVLPEDPFPMGIDTSCISR